jgi:hypothetical protein
MPADRVVDGHQPAAPVRCGEPVVSRLAEVDPANVAEHPCMARLDGHFLARHQRDAVPLGGSR